MTRTVGTLAVLACGALVTLAACGSPARSTAAGSGPTIGVAAPSPVGSVPASIVGTPPPAANTPPPSLAQPPAPPGGPATAVPQSRIDTSHMTAPPAGVTAAARQVTFNVGQSGCQHVTGQVAAQTAKAVTVEVITTNTSRAGQVCPMIVREVPISVSLAAPLGGRVLVFQQVTRHG
jgi:hypothetical protein